MKRTFAAVSGALLSVLSVVTVGCGTRSDESTPPGTRGRLPSPGFAVFPASTLAVAGINLDRAPAASPIWKRNAEQFRQAFSSNGGVDFTGACGFDPFAELKSLVVGVGSGMMVLKGLTRDQVKRCAEHSAARAGTNIVIQPGGDSTGIQLDGHQSWTRWLDDVTMVLFEDKDRLARLVVGEGGLAPDSEMMKILGTVDTAATLYVAAGSAAMAARPFASAIPGARSLGASLDLAHGLVLDARFRFGTAGDAKRFAGSIPQLLAAARNQALPALADLIPFLEKAVVEQREDQVAIQLRLTDQELAALTR